MESYFVRMTSRGNQATKLAKIANVFIKLAETYVHNAARTVHQNSTVERPVTVPRSILPERLVSQTTSTTQTPSSTDFQECATPFDMDISPDVVLSWFNYPDIPSMDIQDNGSISPSDFEVNVQTVAPVDIFGPIMSQRGRKRPLEGDFDWLSWDLSASNAF
jgi:hypothetical protein